ncbi:MAG: integrase arm-type DNA-binding domain-containing protein [Acidobacteria bacterium]|nr:integrase arm-type DNA-binding domain-containing protein [Acidobacteriota bacterium]
MDIVTAGAPQPRKTKPKGRHPHNRLAAAFVRSAPVGRHADGNGLYLYVQRTGTRSWIQRLVNRGRKHELGLGSVHLVSLAEARDQALANRKLARAGGDPLADKRRTQGMPTFAEAAATVVEQKRAGWRSPRQAADWFQSLERHVFPRIGSRPVSEVSSADVLAVLTPIWHVKADTARRLRQRIRAVLEWSIAMEHRADNPCDRIGPVLGPQRDTVRHMRALPHGEVASAIGAVRASKATRAVKLAFEFLVLTAARSGEVRLATWDEIDRDGRLWTIPGPRMKARREHRVPLSGRAGEVLAAARSLADGNPLVFPNRWGNYIKDTFLSQLLKDLDIAAVPHGFRSSFRDWAAEETDHPREVVEAALAHVVRNRVEAAYARSDLFERRRGLMEEWAAYLDGEHGSDHEARR